MAALDVPFQGEDMESLHKSVIKGSYKNIPSIYSEELAAVIRAMLQINPQKRPSSAKMMKSAIFRKTAEKFGIPFTLTSAKNPLLETILIPRDFKYLSRSLPKSNYSTKTLKRNISKTGH